MAQQPAASGNGGEDAGAAVREPRASPQQLVVLDEWGLPVRKVEVKTYSGKGAESIASSPVAKEVPRNEPSKVAAKKEGGETPVAEVEAPAGAKKQEESSSDDDDFKDALSSVPQTVESPRNAAGTETAITAPPTSEPSKDNDAKVDIPPAIATDKAVTGAAEPTTKEGHTRGNTSVSSTTKGHTRGKSSIKGVSEWSHQHVVQIDEPEMKEDSEDEWQDMPAYAPFDIYNDDNKLIAREMQESDEEAATYGGLGGAGKGYTRVQLDDDAQSATSMDEHTSYLFKEVNGTSAAGLEDEEQRDAVAQMQATKDLLTEGQRIAYVGMTRLVLSSMVTDMEKIEGASNAARKTTAVATEAMKMFSQKMMIRLYAHMDISTPEQVMIEQLADHGVEPRDLTPALMQNARVKNPMAENGEAGAGKVASPRPGSVVSPRDSVSTRRRMEEEAAAPPPPYTETDGEHLPEVRTPSQLPTTKNLDIDLRWTVLCDLFLTLVADSIYDARARVLLERVGSHLDVTWLDICRFEKRVTDALEMQQAAEKENWNEDEHKENRRKMALKKRYMMMGLATVGGGLVIGLSAGLLAPVIGAGLAAGFTTIGVAGTSGFLAGAGGAAIITSAAATSGGVIAVRAANRRTGAVKTFEYRPLHNNKRVNLIITVSGWMTGKVDDVRLPYSTVDPVMGDIYSVLWEPEMLQSMGDTINILATEALTQGLQQVLGSTILIGLMAALQLPVILTKLSYLIDNPWTVSLGRAEAAGLILADSLVDRNLGTRPITFVGYSLGCRVIFSCLRELARKGAHGLVQNVYLFGSPIVAKKDDYLKARSVVAGRFVNGYARNDWILGYLFRLTSGGISRIAGLAPVNGIPDLENVDVTDLVPGHMAYRTAMPRLLREVGWLVESDEFTEIEDPDPDNHAQRQRELINEIEEARKEFEREEREKNGKGKFAFLRRKKKDVVQKKEWETYQESTTVEEGEYEGDLKNKHDTVLFDIDAIRRELESENFEVRELPSTLPPMKLDLAGPASSPSSPANLAGLRDTKTTDAVPTLGAYEEPPQTRMPPRSYTYGPDEGYRSYHASPLVVPEEDEVQMSFDTAYAPTSSGLGLDVPSSAAHPAVFALKAEEPWTTENRQIEVSPRASHDAPAEDWRNKPLPDPGRNAWADEEEEEEFGEREMEMTFA